jgi:hypothetical protein
MIGREVKVMSKHRSPNYPAHGLSEAVEFARQIYAKEKRTLAPGEIVAKALGYSSLSGNARVKIATLKKFGLLDGDEAKGMRLTDLAMLVLYPSSPLEEGDAKKTAALTPVLFQMLHEDKQGSSDDAIINHLISRMDFSPLGAKQALDAFRDTMSFAGLSGAAYNAFRTPDGVEAQPVQTETRSASAVEHAVPPVTVPQPSVLNSWTWTLSMPRNVNAELKIAGEPTKSDIARLKKQIEFLEESFDEEHK